MPRKKKERVVEPPKPTSVQIVEQAWAQFNEAINEAYADDRIRAVIDTDDVAMDLCGVGKVRLILTQTPPEPPPPARWVIGDEEEECD
jgi:hypothetical protein